MAKKKRYTVKAACPQCGCSGATVMSEEELKERYGNVPNFSTPAKDACPEWDAECRMKS